MKYWTLSNIDLYAILCPPKINNYNHKHGKRFGREDIIYPENKPGHSIYLVSKGKVKLVNYDSRGNEIVKQILTRGELFGESLILGEEVRTEYAVSCDANTTVCSMSLEAMQQLMRKNERFSTSIYRFIGIKLKKTERRLELLIGKDVTARVACFILDKQKEAGTPAFEHFLSQKDIAVLLATSRESISKVFNKLRQEDIIDFSRKTITIKNQGKLEELSNS